MIPLLFNLIFSLFPSNQQKHLILTNAVWHLLTLWQDKIRQLTSAVDNHAESESHGKDSRGSTILNGQFPDRSTVLMVLTYSYTVFLIYELCHGLLYFLVY